MYPAIIAAAFFTGVILNSLFQNAPPMEIGKLFFFGFIAIVGLIALELRDLPIVAWGLLLIPTIVFASSLVYAFLNPPAAPEPKPLPPAPKPAPKPEEPTVQVPDENTVCVELEFDPSKPKPQPLPTCDVGADGTIGMPGTVPDACPDEPKPSCPTDLVSALGGSVGSGSSSSGSGSGATKTPTLDELLKSMNKSLTPVTVCNA
jgi:hypothetical protein